MPKIIDYFVVEEHTLEELIKKVKLYMNSDWQPLGGVSEVLTETEESCYYYCSQAMVKYEKD